MNPNEPPNHVSTPTVDEIKRQRQERLEMSVMPRGSGSGGWREPYTPPSDFALQRCDFKKWARDDSLPIEQACFVLLGFEPPPLHVLRFRQDTYNPSHEPTWDKPPEYVDALRSLGVSIKHGNISTKQITEYPYETQHVCWPELIHWARSKSYAIPPELESIVAKIEPVVLAETVYKPAPDVTESASGDVEPTKAGPLPLTTGNIAFCFAGLGWDTEQKWKKPLGDKPKWLAACIVIPGVQGVSETRWNPVCIGAALVSRGYAPARSVRAKFQTKSLLMPWLDEWKTYEADNIETK